MTRAPSRWLPPLLVVVALAGCGALDDSAPLRREPKKCKTLDGYLAPLNAHVAAGKMKHVGRIIREDLDRASLRAIVQLLLDTVSALPAGTFQQLATKLNKPGASDTLAPLVIALLEPLPGDMSAAPPRPARLGELKVFSKVATKCLDAGLFQMLTDIIRDERLEPALRELLSGASGLDVDVEQRLRAQGAPGRKALITLFRNVALSIAAPGFDPKPLVAMLDGLSSDSRLMTALRELLTLATLDKDGEPIAARVEALSSFVRCFNGIDGDLLLPEYAYDLVATGAIGAALEVSATTAAAEEDRLQALLATLQVLSHLTAVLAADPGARDALGQAGALLLRPDLAIEAIPEVLDLLRSDVLDDLPSMLADIATQPCLAPDPT